MAALKATLKPRNLRVFIGRGRMDRRYRRVFSSFPLETDESDAKSSYAANIPYKVRFIPLNFVLPFTRGDTTRGVVFFGGRGKGSRFIAGFVGGKLGLIFGDARKNASGST